MHQPETAVAATVGTDIDASPTPYHAVAHAASLLDAAGASEMDATEPWDCRPGLCYLRRGGALVAWRTSGGHDATTGARIVGTHTDSPNLRLKPKPDRSKAGFRQLGVEVYGGVLLNSWLDRDLGLSGRLAVRHGETARLELVRIDEPILRIPQLAIHLDREINEAGLKLDRQLHLSPILGLSDATDGGIVALVADRAGIDPTDVIGFDLMLHDLVPSTLAGIANEFLSAPRIDNLLSSFVAIRALVEIEDPTPHVAVVCLFDHEEVGSGSAAGAGSPLLEVVLDRIAIGFDAEAEDRHRARAGSVMLSADGAHATHPNYADRHEPDHTIALNAGPVLKVNANQRYATDSRSAAEFALACEAAGVPIQTFVSRTDMACGSTIGPISAARLGIDVVDAGCAQLAMHSAREIAGSADPGMFKAAMISFLSR